MKSKLFQGEDYICRDWMFGKKCQNKQDKDADNGLCPNCEKERRIVIRKQLENIKNENEMEMEAEA